jgi:hypothetical protein
MNKIPLRARIRPNIEAAPWVIDELTEIECELAAVTAERDELLDLMRDLLCSRNLTWIHAQMQRAIDAAKQPETTQNLQSQHQVND